MRGNMFCDRLEAADLTIGDGRIDVGYYLNFRSNCQEIMLTEGAEEGMKRQ